jgi:4-azaleucine resistance transporter AzlC
VRACLPVAVSVFAYGAVYDALARAAGLTLAEALWSSALVFAGSAQFAALGLWTTPLPVVALILTTLVINLRHLLLGAAIRDRFAGWSPRATYGALFFLVDENWALTTATSAGGGFLAGSGLVLYVAWVGATLTGALVGGALPEPTRFGLEFAFPAVIIALATSLWRGRSTLLPWAVAAISACLVACWLPGGWPILLGGLAGSTVGAWREVARDVA